MPAATGTRAILRTLGHPDYGLYALGNSVSLIGMWMQRVSVGWLTWDLTHSGTWLGAMAFADLFPTVFIGLIGGVAQIFMTEASSQAPPSVIAPFDYTAMLWALVFGALVFGTFPGPNVLIGASLICASGLFIIHRETVRGVPLVTVLFMASVMLPLFLPAGVTFDKFLRALIGVALFASAYMAEVVRGGLQAIPKGQYEGADSLGLGYWQKMGLIVLPQALKLVIPGIVNTFIGLFKDTSLVYIIGMFDLLGAVRQNFSDATWASPQTPMTGLVFAGFIFWCFCFGMSRYSIFMERLLDTGHKR